MSHRGQATELIRDASDIIRIVGERVALKKSGTRFTGLCPFHRERTPSFSVDPIRRRFHCFGCKTDGDVFDFVARIDGLSFIEAKKKLAVAAGLSWEDRPLTSEERSAWAAERSATKRDLPAARLWRRVAVMQGDDILTLLKASVFDPMVEMVPKLGEFADWERRLAIWRELDGAALVAEYNAERAKNRATVDAMVRAGAISETAEKRALRRFVSAMTVGEDDWA
jgi:CHC2 zinc finger